MTGLFILGYLLITLVVIYFSPRILSWTVTMIVYFVLIHFLANTQVHHFVGYLFATISALIAVFFGFPPLRLLLSRVIFSKAKGVLPSISETERLALNAGDSWYEQEVFRGEPNFELLHNVKKFELTKQEQSFLDNEVNHLCSLLNDWDIIEKTADLSVEAWNYIRQNKSLLANHVICDYRSQMQKLAQIELQRATQRLASGQDQENVITELCGRLVNKLTHVPTIRLRQAALDGHEELLDLAHYIFNKSTEQLSYEEVT